MLYVLVDETTNEAKIYRDATSVADIIGKSYRTIWYHNKKTHKRWGNYILYYVKDNVQKSARGRKQGDMSVYHVNLRQSTNK